MSELEAPPISDYVESLIVERFDSEEAQYHVRAMLLEVRPSRLFREVERVRRDIVILSGGDPTRIRKFVDMAKSDARDVMNRENLGMGYLIAVKKLPLKD